MAWVNIPDTATDPDAPLTSALAKAWTGNFKGMADGDPGAPRIDDTALSTTVKQAGRNWVAQRIVTAQETAVGQYVMAVRAVNQPASFSFGDTVPGNTLFPSDVNRNLGPGIALQGVYRCMGAYEGGASAPPTLWLRIS